MGDYGMLSCMLRPHLLNNDEEVVGLRSAFEPLESSGAKSMTHANKCEPTESHCWQKEHMPC